MKVYISMSDAVDANKALDEFRASIKSIVEGFNFHRVVGLGEGVPPIMRVVMKKEEADNIESKLKEKGFKPASFTSFPGFPRKGTGFEKGSQKVLVSDPSNIGLVHVYLSVF